MHTISRIYLLTFPDGMISVKDIMLWHCAYSIASRITFCVALVVLTSGCVSAVPVNVEPPSKLVDYSGVKPVNHELLAVRYAKMY